jgi:hypothetical protein
MPVGVSLPFCRSKPLSKTGDDVDGKARTTRSEKAAEVGHELVNSKAPITQVEFPISNTSRPYDYFIASVVIQSNRAFGTLLP